MAPCATTTKAPATLPLTWPTSSSSGRTSTSSSSLSFPPGGFYPLARVPRIRVDDSGEREMVAAKWRLLPFWWKPSDKTPKRSAFQRKCFNARSADVDNKPSFREAFKRRRCLLPAGEFFEKGHYFRFADDRSFAFAGLWESWKGGDDEVVESCTLLTTEPNELVRSVGHHRMPVLLSSEEEYQLWLDLEAGRSAVERLFVPTDPAIMTSRAAT
jgi:putative SOS response-associated peptidase YedK